MFPCRWSPAMRLHWNKYVKILGKMKTIVQLDLGMINWNVSQLWHDQVLEIIICHMSLHVLILHQTFFFFHHFYPSSTLVTRVPDVSFCGNRACTKQEGRNPMARSIIFPAAFRKHNPSATWGHWSLFTRGYHGYLHCDSLFSSSFLQRAVPSFKSAYLFLVTF